MGTYILTKKELLKLYPLRCQLRNLLDKQAEYIAICSPKNEGAKSSTHNIGDTTASTALKLADTNEKISKIVHTINDIKIKIQAIYEPKTVKVIYMRYFQNITWYEIQSNTHVKYQTWIARINKKLSKEKRA